MPDALVLLLALSLQPAPSALSPEAAEHNTKAMVFYDAGQYGPAFDEFYAAYASMPDARRDRAGREILLGSMHGCLLDLHEASGESAPLCRLQKVLQDHVDALEAAFPESPNMLEIRSARGRHTKITGQLAARGPDACAAAPATSTALPATSVEPPVPQPSSPEAAAPRANPAPTRRARRVTPLSSAAGMANSTRARSATWAWSRTAIPAPAQSNARTLHVVMA